MNEIWKDIVGYEGKYQVSNLGRVRSLDRVVSRVMPTGKVFNSHKVPGRMLKKRRRGRSGRLNTPRATYSASV